MGVGLFHKLGRATGEVGGRVGLTRVFLGTVRVRVLNGGLR